MISNRALRDGTFLKERREDQESNWPSAVLAVDYSFNNREAGGQLAVPKLYDL